MDAPNRCGRWLLCRPTSIGACRLRLFEQSHLGQVNTARRPYAAPDVRYWSNSRQRWILARDSLSAYDPSATLAVHCGNGFDAGFSPIKVLVKTDTMPSPELGGGSWGRT